MKTDIVKELNNIINNLEKESQENYSISRMDYTWEYCCGYDMCKDDAVESILRIIKEVQESENHSG